MCGIAGYYGFKRFDNNQIEYCQSLMKRRGPDTQSFKHWEQDTGKHVYLLHSRLSIIDLDHRSDQPFQIGSHWMVLNGELYNYRELKEDLKADKVSFHTESDTEVFLSALSYWGDKALDRCEGMWAFAVYDESDGSISLCRDRFGEKPLYLYRDETGIYFGSEVKFIVALIGHKLKINYDHLFRYLVNGYKALYKGDDTFFKGLTELPPSTVLRLCADGTEEEKKYWSLRYQPDELMTYDEAVAGVRKRLIRSVDIRLRSDVPLAFCMSGGVDSNSLISIAKQIFGYDVHGFTITNTDLRYEESEMVDCAVSKLKILHTPIPLNTKDFLVNLRSLVRQHDAPVYTISYYIHWLLMVSIADYGYKVSVSGTAGDELFTGYYDHHLMYLYDMWNDPLHQSAKKAWEDHIRPLVRNPFLSDPDLFINDPDFRDHIFLDADDFGRYLKSEWKEPFYEEEFTGDLLRNRMLNELLREVIPVILHEDDLNAMFFSIENRSPFLDRDLAEFCYRIPSRYLIRDGITKIILRDAMRGIVPDKIIDNRRKVGFNAPILDLLDIHNPHVREVILSKSPIYNHIRREKIEELLQKNYLANHESKFLFNFLCAKLFLEEFTSEHECGGRNL